MHSAPGAPVERAENFRPTRRRGVLVAVALVAAAALAACAPAASTPAGSALGAGTGMGAVTLLSADPATLAEFYTAGVGLEVLDESADAMTLGADGTPLLIITESSASADDIRAAGLYHSAFLYADERSLAHAIMRTANAGSGAFQGSSDHTVSQAFYFVDPEGNGVELYVDRPRSGWTWNDGLVTMGSQALDPNSFVSTHLGGAEVEPGSSGVIMGHVHLRGGDLAEAEQFYVDVLGFAVTARSEGAIFFAADGYHHHLAVNVWSSAGAGMRTETRGLGLVTVTVADDSELEALEARISAAGLTADRDATSVSVRDPWGTQIRVVVADAATADN